MMYKIIRVKTGRPVMRDLLTEREAAQYVEIYNTKTRYGKKNPVKAVPA